jgi:hypothetical protein
MEQAFYLRTESPISEMLLQIKSRMMNNVKTNLSFYLFSCMKCQVKLVIKNILISMIFYRLIIDNTDFFFVELHIFGQFSTIMNLPKTV